MTRETLSLLARRCLNQDSLGEYMAWAIFMLENGYDTEHLRMLASLSPAPARADITYYFNQTLDELNFSLPPNSVLLRVYALNIAQCILDGTVPPVDGCHTIYSIYRDLDYLREMSSWLYLDDGLEPETYQELEGESWNAAIRQEAQKLLQL